MTLFFYNLKVLAPIILLSTCVTLMLIAAIGAASVDPVVHGPAKISSVSCRFVL